MVTIYETKRVEAPELDGTSWVDETQSKWARLYRDELEHMYGTNNELANELIQKYPDERLLLRLITKSEFDSKTQIETASFKWLFGTGTEVANELMKGDD